MSRQLFKQCFSANFYITYLLKAVLKSALWNIRAGITWDLPGFFRLSVEIFSFHQNNRGSNHFPSVGYTIISLSTSSLFPVNASCITLPSNVRKPSSVSCFLSLIREEAWLVANSTTQSLLRSAQESFCFSAKTPVILLMSAIFLNLPSK